MNKSAKTYTYRGGEKVALEKSPDQMVVRALPASLDDAAIASSEQVSSASTRINTRGADLDALMERSRVVAPTHHAYYEADSGSEFLITDRIFVTFKEALSDQDVDALAGHYALVKVATYSDRDYLFQLTNHTGMNPVKLVVKLTEEEPLIEAAEHDLNQRMSAEQFSVPTDPDYSRQWHLHTHLNDPDFDVRSSALCENSWSLLDGFGSEEVVIAVSDDGCKLDHHDFDSPDKFASWGYFRGSRLVNPMDIDADPRQMYKAGSNHGTSCCGVIGGEIDSVLTVGAAAGCQLLPIQWESSGPSLFISDSKLLTTLNYIADKADVMSNSWGGVPTSVWALPVINRIKSLALTGGRRGKGIVFLWAAGNENCLINHTANQDVPYDHGVDVQGGALVWVGVNTTRVFRNNLVGIPGVMHVAALASTARRSHYSNYGPGIGVCAPSSNSHAYYRMTVRGLGITTTTGESGNVTNSFGGTSSATPLVAGVAALTISSNPNLSALEVISILKQTASKDLNFSDYPRTPPASFDADTGWDVSPVAPFNNGAFIDNGDAEGSWSPWFGHGRVDANAAVAEALSRRQPVGNKVFKASSEPNKSIPDNNIRGIKDKIDCTKVFGLSAITVSVDISHTYIGDLRVSLISPSGSVVPLHDRTGGSANDLQVDFDISSVPGLLALTGEPVKGEWALHVQDLALADRGRLKGWSLDISGQKDTSVVVEDSPGMGIPDNRDAGIERTLSVSKAGLLDSIEVELDITHTYIGDLVVELISPSSTSVLLHNRTGGSANNIIKTYSLINTTALQVFMGETVKGAWKLKVSDHAGVDQGKLNRWALKIVLIT
ncbi:proprotein convertase P-domain-containing protein [Neptunomonas qingdaonensis]|uniref:Regulatory P domain of the subtilisin-like proprotein convertase n=1 Tax=Neptunomonas qingdaonensis TaxID=1045558 RepID=A0A1I2PFP5_9GAMM|nr:proprotein convertase P-domain-containing protein [Neptunomonas qingdaonensis]SFG14283.1 Regulatory P domain of the subtilisin-like proprotein convertase [Neptunomonas qingdaonensis]